MDVMKQNPVREKGEFFNQVLPLYNQEVTLMINPYREEVAENGGYFKLVFTIGHH